MIRAVIIDDELDAREHLKFLLSSDCPDVSIVGEAISVASGISAIEKLAPNLIFLDINLPDGSGFNILKNFQTIDFGIVFVTAYSEYAIEAFRFSALHYLLKPIDPEDLAKAVKKAANELSKQNLETRLKSLYYNLQNNSDKSKKVVLTSNTTWFVINSDEIILCKSEKNYTEFHISDGRNITVSKTIKDYDDLLSPHGFFRVHKQYLININHIKSFDKKGTGVLYMTNNYSIPVSARVRTQLLKFIINL